MNNANNHIDKLTPELMLRYQNGDLSDREMHQVERLLLDAEFESEAMEGAGLLTGEEFHKDLSVLQSRLDQQTRTPGTARWWWAAAASVVLVISATFLFLQRPDQKELAIGPSVVTESEMLAENNSEEPAPQTDDTAIDTSTQYRENEQAIALLDEQESDVENTTTDESAQHPSKEITSAKPEAAESSQATEDADVIDFKEINSLPRMAADTSPQGALAQTTIEYKEKELVGVIKGEEMTPLTSTSGTAKRLEQFHGRVIDRRGEPVRNASVLVPRSNIAVVTDTDGEFDLTMEEGDGTVVSEVGLKSRQLSVPSSDSVTILLEDRENFLGEVVVSDGDAPSKNVIYRGAGPRGGLAAFENYIRENIRNPEGDSIMTEVTVMFRVRSDGSLYEFKIRKTPGSAYSDEALRLIKEGPVWLPALQDGVPMDDRVRVRILFGE